MFCGIFHSKRLKISEFGVCQKLSCSSTFCLPGLDDPTHQTNILSRSGRNLLFFSQFSSVAQSCPILCDPMNHSMPGLPCPSPSPGVHSDSCPLSQWCHPAISSSVVPFSSCPQSLPRIKQNWSWKGKIILSVKWDFTTDVVTLKRWVVFTNNLCSIRVYQCPKCLLEPGGSRGGGCTALYLLDIFFHPNVAMVLQLLAT